MGRGIARVLAGRRGRVIALGLERVLAWVLAWVIARVLAGKRGRVIALGKFIPYHTPAVMCAAVCFFSFFFEREKIRPIAGRSRCATGPIVDASHRRIGGRAQG